jgi:hypothetical protein
MKSPLLFSDAQVMALQIEAAAQFIFFSVKHLENRCYWQGTFGN